MSKQIYLHIPEPCHENWEAMSPVQQGRFCQSCSKQVVDFSSMSDKQILEVLSKAAGKTCGRFSSNQLQRPVVPEIPYLLKPKKMFLSAFIPAFIVSGVACGQDKLKGKVALKQSTEVVKLMGDTVMTQPQESKTAGRVAFDNGDPVAGAVINIKGSTAKIISDKEGNFTFSFPGKQQKITLIINYPGYETREVQALRNNTGPVIIKLLEEQTITLGMIMPRIVEDEDAPAITEKKPEKKITIKGKVVDKTGKPVPNATITLKKLKSNIVSDSLGKFAYSQWTDKDRDQVKTVAAGYKEQIKRVDYDNDNSALQLVLEKKITLEDPKVRCTAASSLQGIAGGLSIVTPVSTSDTVVTFITKAFNIEMFRVYPNPSSKGSDVNFIFKNPGDYTLQVFDNSGKLYLLKEIKVSNKMQVIPLTMPETLSGGMYYVKAVNILSGKQFIDKLIIR